MEGWSAPYCRLARRAKIEERSRDGHGRSSTGEQLASIDESALEEWSGVAHWERDGRWQECQSGAGKKRRKEIDSGGGGKPIDTIRW